MYIYTNTLIIKNTNLHRKEVKIGERRKKVINKTIKNLHRQLTPKGQPQTLNMESTRIKTIYEAAFYYKEIQHAINYPIARRGLKCLKHMLHKSMKL